jgi:hypothetical protein
MRYSSLAAVLLASALAAPLSFAQTEAATAVIAGTVTDQDGAIITEANITIEHTEKGINRSTLTNEQGIYRAALLPLGDYVVRVKYPGFAIVERTGIHLGVGQQLSIDFTLTPASVSETVTVHAEAPPVETARYERTQIIGQQSISSLPINGRDFSDFALLSPTVAEKTSSNGKSISVGGGSGLTTGLTVDGADYKASFRGMQTGATSPYILSQEAVQEFEVVRAGFSAEFGRSMGGRINVVTKSGNNEFHGSAFYYFRDSALATDDALGRPQSFRTQQMGGSIGGPIVRDKLFFFGAYDQQRQSLPLYLNIPAALANAVDALAPSMHILGQSGAFQQTNNGFNSFVRGDYNLSANHQLSARYNYLNSNQANINTNPNAGLGTERDQKGYVQNGMLSYNAVLGNKLNEARVQLSRDNQPIGSNPLGVGQPAASVIVNGVNYSVGGPTSEQNPFYQNRDEVMDNFSYIRGAHSFKFGVDFNQTGLSQYYASNPNGNYTFTSLANFIAGAPTSFSQYVPLNGLTVRQAATTDFTTRELALFAQDTYRIARGLTMNYGLRWEGQWNPQPKTNPDYSLTGKIPNSLTDFAPRLGVSWDPTNKGRTVVRLGAGYFYSRNDGIDFIRAFDTNGTTGAGITLTPAGAGGNLIPVFPTKFEGFSSLPASAIPPLNITYFDGHFASPRTIQWTGGVEHEIAGGVTVSADLIMSNTVHGDKMRNVNLFPTTSIDADGRPIYNNRVRPNMEFNQIRVIESSARATYNALVLAVQKRASRHLQVQASYTFSHTRDDAGDSFNGVWTVNTQDNFNARDDFGYAATDVRHRAVLSTVWSLPFGIAWSQIVSYQTAVPFNGILATDANGDGNLNDRAYHNGVVEPLNNYRQPRSFNWNLRLMKDFSLKSERRVVQTSAELFNLTNASNFTTTNTTYGTASFGKSNVPGSSFQAQFAVRYRF